MGTGKRVVDPPWNERVVMVLPWLSVVVTITAVLGRKGVVFGLLVGVVPPGLLSGEFVVPWLLTGVDGAGLLLAGVDGVGLSLTGVDGVGLLLLTGVDDGGLLLTGVDGGGLLLSTGVDGAGLSLAGADGVGLLLLTGVDGGLLLLTGVGGGGLLLLAGVDGAGLLTGVDGTGLLGTIGPSVGVGAPWLLDATGMPGFPVAPSVLSGLASPAVGVSFPRVPTMVIAGAKDSVPLVVPP